MQPDPEYTGLLPVPPLLVGCAGDDEEKELSEEPPREGEERFSFPEDDTKYREAKRCARLMCQKLTPSASYSNAERVSNKVQYQNQIPFWL